MKALSPAKINLGLHILRRRSDGFHDIETVLYPIGWSDELSVELARGIELFCSDETVPVDEKNLCVRAAMLLRAEAGIDAGARISLQKSIPHGAGLGGGSSNAALTLQLLDRLWKTGFDERVLNKLASRLGSDVPFFLGRNPALATGRGEVLEPLRKDEMPFRLPFHLVVAVPPARVSTAEAYAGVTPDDRAEDLRSIVLSMDLGRWRSELMNDFEASVFERLPAIARLKEEMLNEGAGYAAMSGSGSAVFGVFERAEQAEHAAGTFQKRGLRVWSDVDEGGV